MTVGAYTVKMPCGCGTKFDLVIDGNARNFDCPGCGNRWGVTFPEHYGIKFPKFTYLGGRDERPEAMEKTDADKR